MRSYQIVELEKLTGIKAHTIRIWEKRYKLITPDRTDTNYRRYNDEQLKKLLNISTLISLGYKISHIAAFSEKEIVQKVLENHSGNEESITCNVFINDLLATMLRYDELGFEKSYVASITRFGLYDTVIKVLYPLLKKIGFMWTVNEIIPSQEHFASYLIKRKLMAATDSLPVRKKKKKKFLLCLLPMEHHDIGLVFANYILKAKGYETIYLGQDVPYSNIMSVIKETKPHFFFTFFTLSQNPQDIYLELKKHLGLPATTTFLVGGNERITSFLNEKIKLQVMESPADLLKYLKQLD